jgi:hypothetical protein
VVFPSSKFQHGSFKLGQRLRAVRVGHECRLPIMHHIGADLQARMPRSRRKAAMATLRLTLLAGLALCMQAEAAGVSSQMTGNSYPALASSMFPSSSGTRVTKLHYTPTYMLNPFFGPASGGTYVSITPPMCRIPSIANRSTHAMPCAWCVPIHIGPQWGAVTLDRVRLQARETGPVSGCGLAL